MKLDNNTVPVVGKGAMIQLGIKNMGIWQVIEVSNNLKRVVFQKCDAKDEYMTLVWKWNSWRMECKAYHTHETCKYDYLKVNIIWEA